MGRVGTAAATLAASLLLIATAEAQTSGRQNVPPSGGDNARAQVPPDLKQQSVGGQGTDVQSERNAGGSPGSAAPAPPGGGSQSANVTPNPLSAPGPAPQSSSGH